MKYLLFLTLLIQLLISCNKESISNDNNPTNNYFPKDTILIIVEGISLENGLVKTLTTTSATVGANVPTIAPTNAPIIDHGHMLFTYIPTLDDIESNNYLYKSSYGEILSPNFIFESTFENLISNTVYYYVAYVEATSNNQKVTALSSYMNDGNLTLDIRSFTTINNEFPPSVTTTSPEYIGPNNFTIVGVLTETADTKLDEFGILWKEGESTIPTVLDYSGKIISGMNISHSNGYTFEEIITVESNKLFRISCYAKNAYGVGYSDTYLIFGEFDWKIYASIPNSIFQVCFEELFRNNERNWDTSGSEDYNIDYYLSTSNNYYNIDNNEENISWNLSTKDINLINLENYQIDLDVRVAQGDSNSGLRWEGDNNNFGYLFGFDREDKRYSIGYWENDEYVNLKSEINEDLLSENDYHKLTVRKLNGSFFLFIDEIFIYSFNDIKFDGNLILFRSGPKSDVYFKNFYVKSFEQCN